jgi:hypothetical protein
MKIDRLFLPNDDPFVVEMKEFMDAYIEDHTDDMKIVPWNKGRSGMQTAWNKGKKMPPMSEAQKEKLRQANIGKTLSEEHKKKIGRANAISRKGVVPWNKGIKHIDKSSFIRREYVVIHPDGHTEKVTNMREFCIAHNLSPSRMCLLANGKGISHKGYRIG